MASASRGRAVAITTKRRFLWRNTLVTYLLKFCDASSSSNAFVITPSSTRCGFITQSSRQCTSISTLALKYASQAATTTDNNGGPMSKVDSSTTGCPFLTTGYIHKTYAIPALFNDVDSRSIVLFDGECNLCNRFVQTLLKYDTSSNLRFAALQSRVGDLLLRRMSNELRGHVMTSSSSSLVEVGEEVEEKYKSMVGSM